MSYAIQVDRAGGPEVMVRRLLHRAGYRFRLHAGDLPGRPDIVFRGRRKVIFVHGCFWHRHDGCKQTTTPKTRREFWANKFAANRKRDAAAVSCLLCNRSGIGARGSIGPQDGTREAVVRAPLRRRTWRLRAAPRYGPVAGLAPRVRGGIRARRAWARPILRGRCRVCGASRSSAGRCV